MIQLRLALRECKKEWPKHISMVLQMACILFLTIVSVSTVIYRRHRTDRYAYQQAY